MERDGRIVYLGTEGNSKSLLGLRAVLAAGWTVALVVGYERAKRPAPRSAGKRLATWAFDVVDRVVIGPRVSADVEPCATLAEQCGARDIPYAPTPKKTLRDLASRIEEAEPAVILSNGWMFKIRPEVFALARVAALNCHSSFLPEYRGGNVTYAPLINEESESGVTVHELEARFDAGRILAQARVPIHPGDTPESLEARRARATGDVLVEALDVAGDEARYRPNPESPFYLRCSYGFFRRRRLTNALRRRLGLAPRRYEPVVRDDL